MSATIKSDKVFQPQVAADHIMAYFDRKMGLGQLADRNTALEGAKGDKVTFPYFKSIGAAEEPAETDVLTVAALQDDSFLITVKEIGKAVGWKDAALKKSGAGKQSEEDEAQRQIGQVLAEKVDADIITLLNTTGSYDQGYTSSVAADKCSLESILEAKIIGFGDKHDQAVAIALHSLHFLDLMTSASTGFLKADATHPLFGAPGYQGMLLGMAIFVLDTLPAHANIDSKKAYECFIMKSNPFGIATKQEMLVERDRDILARENVMAATMWYGLTSLHKKVATLDKRVVRASFVTRVAA